MFNAEKLRIYRRSAGWTQQQLADAAGCDRNTISRVEIGRLKPSEGLVERMAGALQIDSDSLRTRHEAELERMAEPLSDAGLDSLTPLERKLLNVLRRMSPTDQGEILGLAIARATGADLRAAVEFVHPRQHGARPAIRTRPLRQKR